MLWLDAFIVGFTRDVLLALGIVVLFAVAGVLIWLECCRENKAKITLYYSDLKSFFYALGVAWLIIVCCVWGGWRWLWLESRVSIKSEFKTADEQRTARELCQHDFDRKMKAAKTDNDRKKIIQKLEDNGIRVNEKNGVKELKFDGLSKVSRQQADWVRIRADLEKMLDRRISVPWEKEKKSSKPSLSDRLNRAALAWVDRLNAWRWIAWLAGGLLVGVIIIIKGWCVGKIGTEAQVEEELLDK